MNKLIYRGYNITEKNGVYSCEDLELSDLTEDQIYKEIDQHKSDELSDRKERAMESGMMHGIGAHNEIMGSDCDNDSYCAEDHMPDN
jgi:hypothetical protein